MPTKKQLSESIASQFAFPETRRDDDPMRRTPEIKSKTVTTLTPEIKSHYPSCCCPECNYEVTQKELDTFNGLCEDCYDLQEKQINKNL